MISIVMTAGLRVLPSSDEAATIVDLSRDLTEDTAAMTKSPGALAIYKIASNDPSIRTTIVLERGKVVAKYIRDDVDSDDPFHVWSVTKSWMSLLVGILVDRSLLAVNETLGEIFQDESDWADVTDDTTDFRKAVTIEEILTMSSGLIMPFDEGRDVETWGGISLSDSLAHPNIGTKGEFSYLPVNNILSHVVKERTSQTPREYLDTNAMAQLGIGETDYDWLQSPDGIETSFHGIKLTPLQMAKFGQLYLQGGYAAPSNDQHLSQTERNKARNNVQRIISQSWIDASFTDHSIDPVTTAGYGYLFWNEGGPYCADGLFGQKICIDLNTERVVVQQCDPDFAGILQGNLDQPLQTDPITPIAINATLSFEAEPVDGMSELGDASGAANGQNAVTVLWLLSLSIMSLIFHRLL